MAVFAERWQWSEKEVLALPLKKRKAYYDIIRELVKKEKAAAARSKRR